MGRRKSEAKAGQSERMVAESAYHVFRSPQLSSVNAAPRVERAQPCQADDFLKLRPLNFTGFIRLSKHKAERWRQSSKICPSHESQIYLQCAGKEKYKVNPLAEFNFEMMQGLILLVHVGSPFRDNPS